jgi:hypothetical protein
VGGFALELFFLILREQHLGGFGPLHHREQKRLGLHPTLYFSNKKNSPKEKKTNMSRFVEVFASKLGRISVRH